MDLFFEMKSKYLYTFQIHMDDIDDVPQWVFSVFTLNVQIEGL